MKLVEVLGWAAIAAYVIHGVQFLEWERGVARPKKPVSLRFTGIIVEALLIALAVWAVTR